MADSDKELLQKFLAGDEESFRKIVERYQSLLINYVYRFTGNREISEEVVQETFMAVWQNVSRFKQDASFRSWIYAIATNRAYNAIRRPRPVCSDNLEENPTSVEEPFHHANEQERAIAVREALLSLSEKERAIFIMRFYEGLSYEEISVASGCPLGTVKSRICYALRKLREILKDFEE